MFLEREAEDDQAQTENKGGWICNDQAGFGIETASVALHIEVTDRVVEEVAGEPPQKHSNDAEKIEVAYWLSAFVAKREDIGRRRNSSAYLRLVPRSRR